MQLWIDINWKHTKKKAIRKQKMPKNYGLVWLAMALIKLVSSCFLLNIAKSWFLFVALISKLELLFITRSWLAFQHCLSPRTLNSYSNVQSYRRCLRNGVSKTASLNVWLLNWLFVYLFDKYIRLQQLFLYVSHIVREGCINGLKNHTFCADIHRNKMQKLRSRFRAGDFYNFRSAWIGLITVFDAILTSRQTSLEKTVFVWKWGVK